MPYDNTHLQDGETRPVRSRLVRFTSSPYPTSRGHWTLIMNTSDIMSAMAALISAIAPWVSYRALANTKKTKFDGKLMELRLRVGGELIPPA